MSEEEKKEITMEDIYEALKAAAIINCFEKEFGPMPHPLRFIAFWRWMRDYEAFRKGAECGEMILKMSMFALKKEEERPVEVMEDK